MNFSDDEAIIRLFQQLQLHSTPGLLARLEIEDKDSDGMLLQPEFTNFMHPLQLSAADQLAILRVGGFVAGKQKLGI